MRTIHALFDLIGIPILVGVFVILYLAEGKYKLRKRVQQRFRRGFINTIVSIPAFTLLRFLLLPAMVWLAAKNQSLHFGLAYLAGWPAWLEAILVFLLLDYTNYLWHILNHKLPFLWRFHLVHHTDLDLDVTTAFRFHFGEIIGSVVYRGLMVFLTGASPEMVLVYEIAFEAATQFHHSNWKLPFGIERILNKVLVTPRMHGIHHSIIRHETDSNYSVIFSFWDRLHKTIRLNVPQAGITIGMPAYPVEKELTIGQLLKLPFQKIRDWPSADDDGEETRETKELKP